MLSQKQRDRKAYALAKEFILKKKAEGITNEILEKYLQHRHIHRPDSINKIYKQILASAQNANMKAGVIGRALGGMEKLAIVLGNFDPKVVIKKYPNWQFVLNKTEKRLKPKGKIRRKPRSIWPHFCQTILSSAQFLSQFSSAEEFYNWVDIFDRDDYARLALPLLLDREVSGFGFALACDFLKELGYINYAKPDVHLKKIFKALGLCSPKANDYQVFKSIIRLAKNANVTPYNADKLFWLIGSGYFYHDKQIGKDGRIGSQKKKFISYARKRLGT